MAGVAFSFGLICSPLSASPPPVDTALVLAVDSSSSVDAGEYLLQMRGFAAAFRDPLVQAGLTGGPNRRSAVTLMEWSNPGWQRQTVGWRIIASPADAEALAREIEDAPRLIDGGGTALGNALDGAVRLLRSGPAVASRRVIDVSGDGRGNMGRGTAGARDAALRLDITINALAIRNEEADLVQWFERHVIGGPGAFVQEAADYGDFAAAIRAKLLRELEAPVAMLKD